MAKRTGVRDFRDFIKTIRGRYLPLYETLTRAGYNSLQSEEYFKLMKKWPANEIFFALVNVKLLGEDLRKYRKGGVMYYYILPHANDRPKNFEQFKEFLDKLFFSIMFYLQFALPPERREESNYFAKFGLIAFLQQEILNSKAKISYMVLEGMDLKEIALEAKEIEACIERRYHSKLDRLLFDEAMVSKRISSSSVSQIFIPASLIYGLAKLTNSELRELRIEWRELSDSLKLVKKQKRAFFLIKILEKMLKKFFIILAEGQKVERLL